MQGSISPTTSMWINVAFLFLTGVAAGAVQFNGIPDGAIAIVKTIATDGAFAISCFNVVFHAFSAGAPGPMADK